MVHKCSIEVHKTLHDTDTECNPDEPPVRQSIKPIHLLRFTTFNYANVNYTSGNPNPIYPHLLFRSSALTYRPTHISLRSPHAVQDQEQGKPMTEEDNLSPASHRQPFPFYAKAKWPSFYFVYNAALNSKFIVLVKSLNPATYNNLHLFQIHRCNMLKPTNSGRPMPTHKDQHSHIPTVFPARLRLSPRNNNTRSPQSSPYNNIHNHYKAVAARLR